jgi:hypothetical protein
MTSRSMQDLRASSISAIVPLMPASSAPPLCDNNQQQLSWKQQCQLNLANEGIWFRKYA